MSTDTTAPPTGPTSDDNDDDVVRPDYARPAASPGPMRSIGMPAEKSKDFGGSTKRLLGRMRQERARLIALVPQETRLSFPIRVRDLVLLGRAPHTSRFGLEHVADLRAAHTAMERAEILDLAERSVDELSGGERQRAVLARALAQDAGILLLDEPTAFLDLKHAVLLLDLVRDLCRARALAVAVVLHDLNLAAMYCDRLIDCCWHSGLISLMMNCDHFCCHPRFFFHHGCLMTDCLLNLP